MREPGTAREAIATRQAPVSRSRSRGSSAMGTLRSASLKARWSPWAASMPARTAAPLPSLTPRAITWSCGQPSAMCWAHSTVSSRLPSSTTMTSYSSPAESMWARTAARVAGRRRCSL
jgi:hypothetical protein